MMPCADRRLGRAVTACACSLAALLAVSALASSAVSAQPLPAGNGIQAVIDTQCGSLALGDHSLVFCNGKEYAEEHGLDAQTLSVATLSTAGDESEIGGEMIVTAPDGPTAEEMCLWCNQGRDDGSNPTSHYRPTCRDVVSGDAFNGVVMWVDNKRQLSYFASVFGSDMSYLEMSVAVATAQVSEEAVPPGYVVSPVGADAVGVDRADQRAAELDGQVTSPAHGGAGVVIFNIDTGIDCSHPEFLNADGTATRCVPAFDRFANAECINNGGSQPCTSALEYACAQDGGGAQQCAFDEHSQGHGTHTAAIAVGRTFGMARDADVRAVKVFDGPEGFGTPQDVLTGMNYVAQMKLLDPTKPMIAAMSLSGTKSLAMEMAIERLALYGVTVVVAAGNNFQADACNFSPSSSPAGITVSSIDAFTDGVSGFANVGPCVDLFAVGSVVASAQPGGGTTTQSGTSMAAPVVAGIAALYYGEFVAAGAPIPDPAQVKADLVLAATDGAIPDPLGSPNKIAYAVFPNTGVSLPPSSAGGGEPPAPTPQPTAQPQPEPTAPPTADESYPCTPLDCNDSTPHPWTKSSDGSMQFCYCDNACFANQDCCGNRLSICGPEVQETTGSEVPALGTCATLQDCGKILTKEGGEQCGCDAACVHYNDCCEGFEATCVADAPPPSCQAVGCDAGKQTYGAGGGLECYCSPDCVQYHDCCSGETGTNGYNQVCSGWGQESVGSAGVDGDRVAAAVSRGDDSALDAQPETAEDDDGGGFTFGSQYVQHHEVDDDAVLSGLSGKAYP